MTTITRRKAADGTFPAALSVEMNPDFTGTVSRDFRQATSDWVQRHRDTVNAYVLYGTGSPDERRILDLLQGAALTVRALAPLRAVDPAEDYLLAQHAANLREALAGALEVAAGLLDCPLGRLDAGTLHAFLGDLAERAEVEL